MRRFRAALSDTSALDRHHGIHVDANACPPSAFQRAGMRVRLTRKLAAQMNGVDVSRRAVGDVFDLPEEDADRLISSDWAAAVEGPLSGGVRGRARASAAKDSSLKT